MHFVTLVLLIIHQLKILKPPLPSLHKLVMPNYYLAAQRLIIANRLREQMAQFY